MSCLSTNMYFIQSETFVDNFSLGFRCRNCDPPDCTVENRRSFREKNFRASDNSRCAWDVEITDPGDFSTQGFFCSSTAVTEMTPVLNKYGEVNQSLYTILEKSYSSTTTLYDPYGACAECCGEGGVTKEQIYAEIKDGKIEVLRESCSTRLGLPAGCFGIDTVCNSSVGSCLNEPPAGGSDACLSEFASSKGIPLGCQKLDEFGDPIYPPELAIGAQGAYYTSYNISLKKEIDKEYAMVSILPLAKEGAKIKLNILENNLPSNFYGDQCPTVSGFKDYKACYQESIPSPDDANTFKPIQSGNYISARAWRVKIGVTEDQLKNDPSQKYTSYAYYNTGAFVSCSESISPCCNDCKCFDGVIIAEKELEIKYDPFSQNYVLNPDDVTKTFLSSDYLEFNNFDYAFNPNDPIPYKTLCFCNTRI